MRAAVLRGPRAAGAARVPLRAQQYRSCVMIILRTSRLWVRARAAALVVLEAVREDVHESYRWLRRARSRAGQTGASGEHTTPYARADADAAADGDVDEPLCACPSQPGRLV